MELEAECNDQPCSIGSFIEDTCHLKRYCRRTGLLQISELSDRDKQLLQWRSGVSLDIVQNGTLCFHHERVLLSQFESTQRYCCDPFKVHKKHVTSKYSYNIYC